MGSVIFNGSPHAMVLDTINDKTELIFKNTHCNNKKYTLPANDPTAPDEFYFIHIEPTNNQKTSSAFTNSINKRKRHKPTENRCQTNQKRKRELLLNTQLVELDPVNDEMVTTHGYRFKKYINNQSSKSVIWVRHAVSLRYENVTSERVRVCPNKARAAGT